MKRLTVKRMTINDMLWKKQLEAAKHINIHPNTLSRRLRGVGGWTLNELNDLADFLGVDIDKLVEMKIAA